MDAANELLASFDSEFLMELLFVVIYLLFVSVLGSLALYFSLHKRIKIASVLMFFALSWFMGFLYYLAKYVITT